MEDSVNIRWGHALGWPKKFLERDEDPMIARVLFVAHYDLHSLHVGLRHLEELEGERKERFLQLLEEHEVVLVTGSGIRIEEKSLAEMREQAEQRLESIASLKEDFPIALIHNGASEYHHFSDDPSLEEQMDRWAAALTPLAEGCHDLGLRTVIENHADYYVSDVVGLCKRVPHLGLFLDTGNCFVVGEKPLDAAREGAPYVQGGHFKDQRVRPVPRGSPMHFEVLSAGLGAGHVPLREIYAEIVKNGPRGVTIEMQIETFPLDPADPLPEYERSIAFVRSLEPK